MSIPDPVPLALWAWALLAVIVALGIAAAALLVRRWARALALRRRFRSASAAEMRAERQLVRDGWTIVTRQVVRRGVVHVDGEPVPFDVRADLVAERDGERVLIEIKTGDAADPMATATRRQLLEYCAVFGVSALYLFDADRERLVHVRFADRSPG